jgi:hypothetical protein
MNAQQGLYENITLIDVQLASVYYPILVDLAKHKHCLTYSELVDRAQCENPDHLETTFTALFGVAYYAAEARTQTVG